MRRKTTGRPMEILLVEDSTTFARITIGALRCGQVAHRLTWLTDGHEAADFLFRRGKHRDAPRPDLILLDLGLPGKDGRELLTELKADDGLRTIPVVVMTSSTAEEDRIESERLQVESFLTKPVDLAKFLLLVRELAQFWHDDLAIPAGS